MIGDSNSVFIYGEVNFPQIPSELLELSTPPVITKDNKDIGYGIKHTKENRLLQACGYGNSLSTHKPLLDWMRKNRVPGIKTEISFQTQLADKQGTPTTHIVHSDIRRVLALNYILDTGGPDVVTSWYQERNMPLRRSKSTGWKQADTGKIEYSNLEVLESVKLEKNKWYLIATDILHDVDNITRDRSSITISFDNHAVLQVLKKLNLLTFTKEITHD